MPDSNQLVNFFLPFLRIYLFSYFFLVPTHFFPLVPTLGPQSVVMTAINSTTLLVSWMPPPFEHQNGIIREYRLNITEMETGMVYRLVTTATSLTVPSLHPFYTYNCTVAAVTIAEGPYSVEVNITMPEDGMF